MNAMRIKALAVSALMVVAFAGAHAWRPTRHLTDMRPKVDLEALFPKSFGEWNVDDRMPVQLVSPDQAAMLNKIYNQTLSRTYINNAGDRVMLSVAYGGDQSDGTQAHRPEVCYPAQGFQVRSSSRASLSLADAHLPVKRLVAHLGGRVEPITYWVVVGDHVALSGTEQKLAQLSYSTRGVIPDGMLVRVSSIDTDFSHAYGLQERWVQALVTAVAPGMRSFVFGRVND